jgi:hypothetical protein
MQAQVEELVFIFFEYRNTVLLIEA